MSNREPDETDFAGVEVYDGTRRLGIVRDRGELAEALLPDGTVVGQFETRRAATDAILAIGKGGGA